MIDISNRLASTSSRVAQLHRQLARGATLTPTEAVAFVRTHGLVLESAKGPVPSLTQAIVGSNFKGSWWSHARGREIFTVTRAVRESDQVLVCRLVDDKVTLVHQRLWPALVRCADRFRPDQLSQLLEEHAPSGEHVIKSIPFPDWVPSAIASEASRLSEDVALALLRSAGAVLAT